MKPQAKVLIIAAAVVLMAGSLVAETLQQFDSVKGRSFHADLYADNACDSCHVNAEPEAYPPDFVCFDCHEADELVQATARPEEDKWQNPHNNMHYAKDVPCMECHGEHSESKVLCAGCHFFEYPNFKK